MKSSKRLLLVPLLLLELAIELHELWNEAATLPQIWFSLFITGLAMEFFGGSNIGMGE